MISKYDRGYYLDFWNKDFTIPCSFEPLCQIMCLHVVTKPDGTFTLIQQVDSLSCIHVWVVTNRNECAMITFCQQLKFWNYYNFFFLICVFVWDFCTWTWTKWRPKWRLKKLLKAKPGVCCGHKHHLIIPKLQIVCWFTASHVLGLALKINCRTYIFKGSIDKPFLETNIKYLPRLERCGIQVSNPPQKNDIMIVN